MKKNYTYNRGSWYYGFTAPGGPGTSVGMAPPTDTAGGGVVIMPPPQIQYSSPAFEVDFSTLSCSQLNSLINTAINILAGSEGNQNLPEVISYYTLKKYQLETQSASKGCSTSSSGGGALTPTGGGDTVTTDPELEVDIYAQDCSKLSALKAKVENVLATSRFSNTAQYDYYTGKLSQINSAISAKCGGSSSGGGTNGTGFPIGTAVPVVNVGAAAIPGIPGFGGGGSAGLSSSSSTTTTKLSLLALMKKNWPWLLIAGAVFAICLYETKEK